MGFPHGSGAKQSACHLGDLSSIPGLGRCPGRGHGNSLQYSCLENTHGQRSLAGYSPWGCKESDTTEHAGAQPTPKQGVGGCSTSLRAEWLHRSFGILLHRICFFSLMYLLIYISMGSYDVHGCLFYSLACNSTQCELFV